MSETYFRVQCGKRDVNDLLDSAEQVSRAWHDTTEEERLARTGISVCDSRENLARYLGTVGQGIPFGMPGWVLVELEGDLSDDQPLDAAFGEYLIHPTRIVSVIEIDDAMFDMIGAAYDVAEGQWA